MRSLRILFAHSIKFDSKNHLIYGQSINYMCTEIKYCARIYADKEAELIQDNYELVRQTTTDLYFLLLIIAFALMRPQ